jgi:hypothetical protein
MTVFNFFECFWSSLGYVSPGGFDEIDSLLLSCTLISSACSIARSSNMRNSKLDVAFTVLTSQFYLQVLNSVQGI